MTMVVRKLIKEPHQQEFFPGDLVSYTYPSVKRYKVIVAINRQWGRQYELRSVDGIGRIVRASQGDLQLAQPGPKHPKPKQRKSPVRNPKIQSPSTSPEHQYQKLSLRAEGFSFGRKYQWPLAVEDEYALDPVTYECPWAPLIVAISPIRASGILDFSTLSIQETLFSDKSYECDICFIHSLGGDVIDSWCHQPSGLIWPRDLLQKDLPTSRILGFGYSSRFAIENQKLDIRSIARDLLTHLTEARTGIPDPWRPIILIGHTFGGLVLKEALNLLSAEPDLAAGLDPGVIVHIMFLGVVHNTESTDFETRWRHILQRTLSEEAVQSVDVPSSIKVIRYVTERFNTAFNISSCTIIEDQSHKDILVSPPLARIRNGIIFAVPKTHVELSVCATSRDEEYILVRRQLRSKIRDHVSSMPVDSQIQECLDALARPGDTSETTFDRIATPFPGTCQWILDVPIFREWLREPHGMLTIGGEPGSGKSVLAKYLVEVLPEVFDERHPIVLKYAFGFANPEGSADSMLRNLLLQLLAAHRSLLQDAVKQYRAYGHKFSRTNSVLLETLVNALQRLSSNSPVVCVIDAIDESKNISGISSESEVLGLLRKLTDLPNVYAVVTLRPGIASRDTISATSLVDINISDYNRNDITKFLQHELQRLQVERPNITVQWLQSNPSRTPVEMRGSSSGLQTLESLYIDKIQRILASPGFDTQIFKQLSGLMLIARGTISLEFILEVFELDRFLIHRSSPIEHEASLKPAFGGEQPNNISGLHELQHCLVPMSDFIRVEGTILSYSHHTVRSFLHKEAQNLLDFDPVQENFRMAWRCISSLELHFANSNSNRPDLEISRSGLEPTAFTSYSVRNWMVHFRDCEHGAPHVLREKAFAMFASEGNLARWANFYEELGTERIPQAGKLGPLLGGACFGLVTVAENSLDANNSVDDVDEHGRTALHWASERGHEAMVNLLIDHKADVNGQDSMMVTALHLAAQKGHMNVVMLLVEKGASIDQQTYDGQTALQLAIEREDYAMAQLLIQKGADALLSTYNESTVVQIASSSKLMSLFEQLVLEPAAKDALVERLISRDSVELMTEFMKVCPDIIFEKFPWTAELVEEGHSIEDVSNWLLKSENVQWVQTATDSDWLALDIQPKHDVQHLPGCAHNLCTGRKDRRVPDDSSDGNMMQITINDTGDIPKSAQTEGNLPEVSGQSPSASSSDERSEVEIHLSELYRREQIMVAVCGIGGVFPPTASVPLNPGFLILKRGLVSVIFGAEEKMTPYLPLEQSAELREIQDPAGQLSTRVADIINADNQDQNEVEDVVITGVSSIGSYNSRIVFTIYEIWDQDQAVRVLEALKNVLRAVRILNKYEGCCSCFSILTGSQLRPGVARVSRCYYVDLKGLFTELQLHTGTSKMKGAGWTQNLSEHCERIFDGWQWGPFARDYLNSSLGHSKSPSRCLHLCALVAQICSIAIVTYTRGHSRAFTHEALSRSIDAFKLRGSDLDGPIVIATRVDLSCLGEMLQRPVWMFYPGDRNIIDIRQKFSLSTLISDLLDLWLGSIIPAPEGEITLVKIHIGGGKLNLAAEKSKEKEEVPCHWTSDTDTRTPASYFSVNDALLIGATLQNSQCNLTTLKCHKQLESSLFFMGTRPPQWKLRGQNVGASIGAKGASVSYTAAFAREDPRNRKRKIMDRWERLHSLPVLNEPVGLEVSLCTGIARRLPLRRLLYGDVLEHLSRMVDDWSKISDIVDRITIIDSKEDFDSFCKDLSANQKDILEAATEVLLLAMEYTGVDKDGHLVLWWPETHVGEPRAIRLDKAAYSCSKPWISMLKDSESCAVFSLLTTRCLEHQDLKLCQNKVANSDGQLLTKIVLDTGLCPVNMSKRISRTSITYNLHKRLELWQQNEFLRVTRAANADGHPVRLEYAARMPDYVRKILAHKYDVVRERQALGDAQQNVLVI